MSEPADREPSKLEQWHSNPAMAAWLRCPMGDFMLEVLAEQSYARLCADTPANVISGHGDALSGKISGYEKALNVLRALRLPPQPGRFNLIESYGVNKPEHATE